jgi:outer membrane protein TolC
LRRKEGAGDGVRLEISQAARYRASRRRGGHRRSRTGRRVLFGPGTSFWTVAANASQTLFDAGALLHKQRATEAAFDQAAAQYKATVLAAFQNVADTLEALKSDADTLKATVAAEKAAKESLDIAERQLAAGAVNYLALLTAENTYEQTLIARVQSSAARFADTAALFQALGGGWWHRDDVPPQGEDLFSFPAFFTP